MNESGEKKQVPPQDLEPRFNDIPGFCRTHLAVHDGRSMCRFM